MPEKYGIRLDSGDLAYLSKKARKMLDEAGFEEATITASSDLDEYIIEALKLQGARVDSWGVGTKLITSKDCPSFGGVYKLAAIKKGDQFIPRIKLSDNQWKITNPVNKKIYRVYDKDSGKIKADLITLEEEQLSSDKPLLLFDPIATWKKTYLKPNSYTLRELLVPIFKDGECVYTSPSVMDIRDYCSKEQDTLWDESRRLVNPHNVYVDLSNKLFDLKAKLLNDNSDTK
jgi:nicotinate phosphoribosyltransferase